jgi:hypothetical protein
MYEWRNNSGEFAVISSKFSIREFNDMHHNQSKQFGNFLDVTQHNIPLYAITLRTVKTYDQRSFGAK